MSKNSKNLLILAGVVVAILLVMALWRGNKNTSGGPGGSLYGGGSKQTETTSASGTYQCADGKSFTLTTLADGTARVSGASSSGVVLHKSDSAHIWISADAKVAVREIAGYTVLIENDKITRDQCYLVK